MFIWLDGVQTRMCTDIKFIHIMYSFWILFFTYLMIYHTFVKIQRLELLRMSLKIIQTIIPICKAAKLCQCRL